MKTLTPEQQAKFEERKAKRAAMVAKFKDVEEPAEPIVGYVSVEDHAYSARNQMYLAHQGCEFGKMGGFQQWRRFGRMVKKGEHGYDIMLPMTKKKEDGTVDDDSTFFSWTVLFHESQTEPLKLNAEATYALEESAT